MNCVRVALIGKRVDDMDRDAVDVALSDNIAQLLGGEFRFSHRIAVQGPAGIL